MNPRKLFAAAIAAAAVALWADILAPGSLLVVRPSGPAILQTLPD
jgi:hypothetical protein